MTTSVANQIHYPSLGTVAVGGSMLCQCLILAAKPYSLSGNTRTLPNAGLMLARRLRRRPNINPALGGSIVSAGFPLILSR